MRSSVTPVVGALALLGVLSLAPLARAEADLRVTSCTLHDDCYCHESNSTVDPQEFILIILDVKNEGDVPVVGLAGNVTITNARIVDGGDSFGPLATPIGPGETWRYRVYYQTTGDCGTTVTLDLTELTSTSGSVTDLIGACDQPIGLLECDPCCLVADVEPVERLLGVKYLSNDVSFIWGEEGVGTSHASHYNTWFVFAFDNRRSIKDARDAGPWPIVPGCRHVPAVGCIHYASLSAPAGSINYYQVRGTCGFVEAAQ